ncbi:MULTISPECIES: efflux RND transporter periplasmic adaptor subunit [Cyanophyceae]|uniref:efflux RND transporter periplasmic adaptor subunit n=1 Tax=Cyanophyceae TaxID=3028117 RepID=UPI001685E266|nr:MULTISPECIES: efflux RND transporter periplasmic adaptor subunit [Cyanophyceae]MBD1915580.1 efflux RND transporter periplasmic adaptor subunit [Phormidium sp. FACHB-77]MBD2031890.1 efflux RND transporter periplasmic adaptor subunit [Phormidium sp. FACHB-322]MBD2050640.1 efflux RND transporter periplasmic adaptor subunit [Leptolyngbya sp. FACHB-60]
MQVPLIGKVRRPLVWLLAGLAAAAVVAGSVGFGVWRSRQSAYDVEAFTTAAAIEPLTVRVAASGTVRPVQTVNLSPENAGVLEELFVEQGDRVEQGQVIARMKSRDTATQVSQNRAAVAEAEAALAELRQGSRPDEITQAEATVEANRAQVRDAQARLDLATSDLARRQQLFDRGAVAATDLDTAAREQRSAQAALEQAQARVTESQRRVDDLRSGPRQEAIAQAEARLAQARAQLDGAQIRQDETLIRAPFGGIVTQKFATEGAFVTPTTSASELSSATSTAIVALAEDLEVLAEVPEADIALIEPGQTVEVVADAFPDQTFAGRVKLVAPEAIERQSVTLFQVRIELIDGKDILRSNMNVNVDFVGDQLADALVVPTVAVVTQAGQSGVLVPGDDRDIVFQPVTLGPQVGDQIQIVDGVEEGDRVFVDLPPGKSLENITVRQQQ